MLRNPFARLIAIAACAVAFAAALAAVPLPAMAQTAATPAPAPAPTQTRFFGKITSIDAKAGTLVLHNKKMGDMNFTIADNARVRVDRKKSTIDDVHAGMFAMVRSNDGKTAIAIMARTHAPVRRNNPNAPAGASPTTPTQ